MGGGNTPHSFHQEDEMSDSTLLRAARISDHASGTVTIGAAASLSDAEDMKGRRLVGIIMPATWTTADITFQASIDGTNFYDLYDQDGNEVTVTSPTASGFIGIYTAFTFVPTHLKVRSGTTGTPVVQAAGRTITLIYQAI